LTAQAKTAWTRQNNVISASLGRVVARKQKGIDLLRSRLSFVLLIGVYRNDNGKHRFQNHFQSMNRLGVKTKNTLNQVMRYIVE